MPQAVWSGTLAFGLVTIPVKLVPATSSKRVRFHQHDKKTGRRVRYKRVAEVGPSEIARPVADVESGPRLALVSESPSDGVEEASPPGISPADPDDEAEVAWDEIVKGYEVEPGRVVTLDARDLDSVAPQVSRVIDVESFVTLDEIDPVYFDKSYHVVPQRGGGNERPYWLLHRTMADAGKVAIGRFVMRTKEYVVAVRPTEHVLMLETLFYEDEVRDPNEMLIGTMYEAPEREAMVARQLLDALTTKWEPARYRDEQRERLLDLIEKRADSAIVVPQVESGTRSSDVTDLMDALLASVEAAKKSRGGKKRAGGSGAP